jgi:hypothetical protein
LIGTHSHVSDMQVILKPVQGRVQVPAVESVGVIFHVVWTREHFQMSTRGM